MKFHEYKDTYLLYKPQLPRSITQEQFYQIQLHQHAAVPGDFNHLIMERQWVKDGRPYYNMFPKIIPHLFRVKEQNVPVESISLPLDTLVLRFPEKCEDLYFEYDGVKHYLKTVMLGRFLDKGLSKPSEPPKYYSLLAYMDVGESDENDVVYTYQRIPLVPGTTIGQAVKGLPSDLHGVIAPGWFFDKVLKMICTICLLSKNIDDAIIIPDLLNSDKKKLDSLSNEDFDRLHAKAKRNGKFGWNVGEQMTVAPHVRSGSPLALYWTGKGRTQMTYRPRKGCVVHRKIVNTLPTGYQSEPNLVTE